MNTLIVALQKDGKLVPASFELISVAGSLGGEITTVVLADKAESLANELAVRGGGKTLAVSNPALRYFNDEVYANVVKELIEKYSPDVVLGPATFYGKALFGRLASLMGGTMTSEVTGLSMEDGRLVVTRPSYGGSVITSTAARSTDEPYFVTVRPKIFPESGDGVGKVVTETVSDACFESRQTVTEMKVESAGTQNLAEADVIVSAGRGIRGPENVDVIKELANSLGAAFGTSRAVVDAGWAPYSTQVGQTGRTVNPKLYIAVGISGAIQHLVGMQTSQNIVAINKDKEAPIFNIAGYGIVGDLFEIVPALTSKFKAELS